MKAHKIPDEKNGVYTVFEAKNIEFCDPIKYFTECFILHRVSIERDLLRIKVPFSIEEIDEFLYKRNIKEWDVEYQKIVATEIPPNFILLLKSKSKKEQIKLLKGQSLNPDQLIAFIFKAWTDFEFSFSTYSAEHYHSGLDKADLPRLVHVKDNSVEKVGNTSLTDGQLKQVVAQRKVIVSKFFDNGNNWHCFFLTFNSLRGEETCKDGQPHFHYISDKFGIKREIVVNQLKSKYYNLGTLPHIDLLDYRNEKTNAPSKKQA